MTKTTEYIYCLDCLKEVEGDECVGHEKRRGVKYETHLDEKFREFAG